MIISFLLLYFYQTFLAGRGSWDPCLAMAMFVMHISMTYLGQTTWLEKKWRCEYKIIIAANNIIFKLNFFNLVSLFSVFVLFAVIHCLSSPYHFKLHFNQLFLHLLFNFQQSIAYFPLVLLVSAAVGSTISDKLNTKLGSKVKQKNKWSIGFVLC